MTTSTNHVHTQMQTGHIGLNVTDIERSGAFYREVFGFEVMGESQQLERRYMFLGSGGKLLVTLWQQSEGRFEKHLPGLHHLSFQVEAIEQVRAVEHKLKELNVHFLHEGIVPHAEGAQSGGVFFEDPDGLRLEVYAPSGADSHSAPTPGAPSCGFF